jgi:drug/metabolite transporter (DMT)-like permease
MKKDAILPAASYLIIPLGILAVSSASLFIRFAQDYAPSITIAAFRLGLAALILLPYTIWRYSDDLKALSRSDLGWGIVAGLFLAIHFWSWITSLEYTSVASSVVLVTTTPLWVSLLAPLFLGEKNSRLTTIGMFISLAGGVIITLSDVCVWLPTGLSCAENLANLESKALLGDLLALLGAVAGACYLMIGRRLRVKISLTPYVFLVYSTAAIFLVLVMLIMFGPPSIYPGKVYGWLIMLAVIPQLIGHSIFNWSLKYLPTGYVSINLLGEPIGSSILAYFFLDEMPSAVKIIGAILILAGIGLASFSQNKVKKTVLPQET